MKYVIIGAGVAGVEAAKVIRAQDGDGEIVMVSADTQVHSRCMLHKFISGERDEKGLDFTEEDFFAKYRIDWKKGSRAKEIDTENRKVFLDTGSIMAGCSLPPVRTALSRR